MRESERAVPDRQLGQHGCAGHDTGGLGSGAELCGVLSVRQRLLQRDRQRTRLRVRGLFREVRQRLCGDPQHRVLRRIPGMEPERAALGPFSGRGARLDRRVCGRRGRARRRTRRRDIRRRRRRRAVVGRPGQPHRLGRERDHGDGLRR